MTHKTLHVNGVKLFVAFAPLSIPFCINKFIFFYMCDVIVSVKWFQLFGPHDILNIT